MRVLAIFLAVVSAGAQPSTLAELRRSFEHPPEDARILMRWWWFGPAVTQPELEREMRLMKEAGIGGFEVQPVYPLELDGNFRYLSPEFLDALKFAGQKARELGLRMDLTMGSGWPFGGPHIPAGLAAQRLRIAPAPRTEIGEGEQLAATLSGESFIASRTRQTVKRAAVGAEGYVLDHYSRSALEAHLKAVGEPMLEALRDTPPYAVFSDSLEVYNSDWTGEFLPEFQKRRGYDLTPYLPALAADVGVNTRAIRRDWGKTLSELADDRYLKPLRQWAQEHGTRLRSQTYGTPPVSLSSNALVDLPEGEGWNWRAFSGTRWASSASHLYGRSVASSETWTWLHSPAFRATPLDMKAEADRHFLSGINQLVGHGWPYSPPKAEEPGWRFYAAGAFNEHNPWWIVMPEIAVYLQRMSFVLRQGQPVNDVAIYLPTDDALADFTLGRVSLNEAIAARLDRDLIPQILDAGYNFDFIDDTAIARVGVPYPVLILPAIERISLDAYRKIEAYAHQGGIVLALGRLPSLAPGMDRDGESPRIQELSRTLFQAPGARGRSITDGAALTRYLAPDAVLPRGVGFVHRKLPFADIYFLANTTNQPITGRAVLRGARHAASWWSPLSGNVVAQPGNVVLHLEPYESRVLVFSDGPFGDRPAIHNPHAGMMDLSSGWSLSFAGVAQPIHLSGLRSWTDFAPHQFFSGLATYEKTVTIGKAMAGSRLYLDFGPGVPMVTEEKRSGNGMRAMLESPVREAALVYVNEKRAGSVWCPPYRIEVSGLLRSGGNTIRIVVGNLAVNRLAGSPMPDYRELNARFGERFQPQDMSNLQPLPSGLLGAIRLVNSPQPVRAAK
jgi:hypothetical protein